MAKRRAVDQITKDGMFARDDGSSSDDDAPGAAQKADADVMARRKIAVPRSRLARPADAPARAPAAAASPFASLSQPAAAAPNTAPSGSAAKPFAFLSSSSSAARPASSSSVFPLSGSDSGSSSGSGSGSGSVHNTTTGTIHTSQELKWRGLNSSFAAKVAKANENSPFADWTHMCEKYLEYAKTIAAGTAASPASSPAPAATKTGSPAANPEPVAKASSGPKPAGFTFSAGPTSSATSFQFGDKKVDIRDTTAQPAKPTGGFVFNANGKGEIRGGAAASSNTPADKPADKPTEKHAFTFGKSDASTASAADNKPANAFGFGKSAQQESTKPQFTFGQSSADDASKPKFSFGASKDSEGAKSAFSFGAAKQDNNSESSQPKFSFGASKPAEVSKDAESSKPAVTFGSNSAASGESAPKFSFGASNDDSKSKFSFGASKPADGEAPKPAFSFGASKPTDGEIAKPAFSFGAAKDGAEAKPAFSFGSSASSDSKPFSFGAKSDTKPAFTFGAAPQDSAAKPAFTFGSSNNNSATNSAGSGDASNSHRSSLSLGTGVNPFGSTQGDATWKPGSAVNIVAGDASGTANSGAATPGTATPGTATLGTAAPGAGDKPGETGEPGEPGDEQTDPQTDLGGPGPGEENEDSVYEKKAKLFELVNGEYKTQGLGMLRVLVHKETGKARALLRAEGSGRVLLNVMLRKEFNYTVVGKGQVKVLDVKSGTDAPTVYLLRVKTEEDGNALKDKLEEVKK